MVALRVADGRYVAWLAASIPPAIVVYHYISLRRVFGGSRWLTAWKGTLLAIVYAVVVFGTMIAIGLRSVRSPS